MLASFHDIAPAPSWSELRVRFADLGHGGRVDAVKLVARARSLDDCTQVRALAASRTDGLPCIGTFFFLVQPSLPSPFLRAYSMGRVHGDRPSDLHGRARRPVARDQRLFHARDASAPARGRRPGSGTCTRTLSTAFSVRAAQDISLSLHSSPCARFTSCRRCSDCARVRRFTCLELRSSSPCRRSFTTLVRGWRG